MERSRLLEVQSGSRIPVVLDEPQGTEFKNTEYKIPSATVTSTVDAVVDRIVSNGLWLRVTRDHACLRCSPEELSDSARLIIKSSRFFLPHKDTCQLGLVPEQTVTIAIPPVCVIKMAVWVYVLPLLGMLLVGIVTQNFCGQFESDVLSGDAIIGVGLLLGLVGTAFLLRCLFPLVAHHFAQIVLMKDGEK